MELWTHSYLLCICVRFDLLFVSYSVKLDCRPLAHSSSFLHRKLSGHHQTKPGIYNSYSLRIIIIVCKWNRIFDFGKLPDLAAQLNDSLLQRLLHLERLCILLVEGTNADCCNDFSAIALADSAARWYSSFSNNLIIWHVTWHFQAFTRIPSIILHVAPKSAWSIWLGSSSQRRMFRINAFRP